MAVDGIDNRLAGGQQLGTVRPAGVRPGGPATPAAPAASASQGSAASASRAPQASFSEILSREMAGDLRFSAHAQARMAARRMSLGREELTRLAAGVNRAEAKGSRESLVLMDDKAFVVSVRNKTVITAVDGEHIKENVFTNIDSAVIV